MRSHQSVLDLVNFLTLLLTARLRFPSQCDDRLWVFSYLLLFLVKILLSSEMFSYCCFSYFSRWSVSSFVRRVSSVNSVPEWSWNYFIYVNHTGNKCINDRFYSIYSQQKISKLSIDWFVWLSNRQFTYYFVTNPQSPAQNTSKT